MWSFTKYDAKICVTLLAAALLAAYDGALSNGLELFMLPAVELTFTTCDGSKLPLLASFNNGTNARVS